MSTTRIVYRLPADFEETAAAELWAAGTLGLEVKDGDEGRVRVEAYFSGDGPESDPLLGFSGVERVGIERVEERDWLAEYRARARPFAVGRRLWVDPGEPEGAAPAAPEGRRLLRLPARTAFGTGSHESTRLAVELLEDVGVAGRSVLDVGTGTGVLAFAALALGARRAVAFDVDPGAALYARTASRLNALRPRLFAGEVAALAAAVRFDLALVNVIPELILPALPEIAARVGDEGGGGGELVLSGILAERGNSVLERAGALGFVERGRRTAGEWIAFRLARERRAAADRPAGGGAGRAFGGSAPPRDSSGSAGIARTAGRRRRGGHR